MEDYKESKAATTDAFGFEPLEAGATNEAGHLLGIPPKDVRDIVNKLSSSFRYTIGGKGGEERIAATDVAGEELEILNKYAAQLAGVAACTVRAIYGCGSCSLGCRRGGGDEIIIFCKEGNLVETDCGVQCWYCCTDAG
jgi:hypothetical protein